MYPESQHQASELWGPTPALLPGKSHGRSTLAWKIPWTEEPGGLQSMGSLRVGHDWATSLSLFTFMHWRRKWQPTPVFLPGESQGWRSLMGCHLWGRRVRHDWSDLAAAVAAAAGFRKRRCNITSNGIDYFVITYTCTFNKSETVFVLLSK